GLDFGQYLHAKLQILLGKGGQTRPAGPDRAGPNS
ncbi:unnamed protein product, partial [marine sediment metagenome]